MTKRMDMYRIANAFDRAAIEGHYEQCRSIIANFAHVYREDYQSVLIMVSVSLMDPTDYSYADYGKIKRTIIEMMEETR